LIEVGWFERSETQRKKAMPVNISVMYYRLPKKVPDVGRISEAPSDTVKYLANYYYQHFILSDGWKVP